jgi:ornithine carbamoyltransferase
VYQHRSATRALMGIKAEGGSTGTLLPIMEVVRTRPMDLPAVPPVALVASGTAGGSEHAAVLERARALLLASRDGRSTSPLRGKNIGLVCGFDECQEGGVFKQAAAELGAQVADVRPSLTDESSEAEVAQTARMLSRLYDAVVLQGGHSRTLASRLREAAQVPVLEGIGSSTHMTAALASTVDPALSTAEARRFVIQAVLLGAMA